METALLYKKLEKNKVQCLACLRKCVIAPGGTGTCGNRKNNKGTLEEMFPNIIVADITTIGEKPILYLSDGNGYVSADTPVLSVGGYYCNLSCLECPNPSMSHPKEETVKSSKYLFPEEIIKRAKESGIKYIALTYNEFIPFPKTVSEITKGAKEKGIETILVTNTTFTKEFIDMFYQNGGGIVKLDLKASIRSGNKFYKDYCNLEIKENGEVVTITKILENIKYAKDLGLHVELTTAITPYSYVPSNFCCLNEFRETAEWIKENIGADIPWHLALLSPKGKWIDRDLNMYRIKHYAELAKAVGLKNVDVIDKMCDCREKELFEKGCCK